MGKRIITIKNIDDRLKKIRPYKNRNIAVTIAAGGTADINIFDCAIPTQLNPTRFFKQLGFSVIRQGVQGQAPALNPNIVPQPVRDKIMAAEPENSPVPPIATVTPGKKNMVEDNIDGASNTVKDVVSEVTLKLGDGTFKHFNRNNGTWQGLRILKAWVIGRVIFDAKSETYYVVDAIKGDAMTCTPKTKEEAIAITGSEA